MRDQNRPLEPTEVSYILEGKIKGSLPLSPLDLAFEHPGKWVCTDSRKLTFSDLVDESWLVPIR